MPGNIQLTVRREGNEAVVSVRDSGLGIPADMLYRVFDMFAQIDRTLKRAQGGLGIGLTLARNLVEMHGGSIDVQSEGLGKGSEFTVRSANGSAADHVAGNSGFDRQVIRTGAVSMPGIGC